MCVVLPVPQRKCVIIAIYDKGMQPGSCNDVVEKLGKFLLESDY